MGKNIPKLLVDMGQLYAVLETIETALFSARSGVEIDHDEVRDGLHNLSRLQTEYLSLADTAHLFMTDLKSKSAALARTWEAEELVPDDGVHKAYHMAQRLIGGIDRELNEADKPLFGFSFSLGWGRDK